MVADGGMTTNPTTETAWYFLLASIPPVQAVCTPAMAAVVRGTRKKALAQISGTDSCALETAVLRIRDVCRCTYTAYRGPAVSRTCYARR